MKIFEKMSISTVRICFLTASLMLLSTLAGKEGKMNYTPARYSVDETDVHPYILPPLAGKEPLTAKSWQERRRPEILQLLKDECYGELLPAPDRTEVTLLNEKHGALGGTAIRREVKITFVMTDGREHSVIMLVYLPAKRSGKVPAFLGLNFKGNHHTTGETDVLPTGGEFVESGHALQQHRWCFDKVIARGYASATICYHDLHPDKINNTGKSVFALFFPRERYPQIMEKYSVIGAWAWGLSRAYEVLSAMPEIAGDRVIVHGHSRLGKTALWAGASDQRFAMVISNNSGCGGAALHKRKFGENLSQHFEAHVQRGVPVWFVRKLHDYIGKEETLPFDAHYLLALIAPRQLCVASATEDLSADPRGEFLACAAAAEVYSCFGYPPFAAGKMPGAGEHVPGIIHYHLRKGIHDQTPHDWERYLDAADRYFKQP